MNKSFNLTKFLIDQRSIIALITLIVVVSFLNPDFFTTDNLLNILRQTSVNAIIAIGMTFVILIAGIDLSVGSVLALTGAVAATLVGMDLPVYVVIPTVLIFGGLIVWFLIVEPHGLAKLWAIAKQKLRLWPFPH